SLKAWMIRSFQLALCLSVLVVGTASAQKKKTSKAQAKAPPAATKRPPPDSAVMIAESVQPKNRTKADSISLVAAIRAGLKNSDWPVKTVAPLAGSILPAKRIVAFYGNPIAKKMGILGEIPPDQMLAKFDTIVAQWKAAD